MPERGPRLAISKSGRTGDLLWPKIVEGEEASDPDGSHRVGSGRTTNGGTDGCICLRTCTRSTAV